MRRIVIEDQSFVWNDEKKFGAEKLSCLLHYMRCLMRFSLSRYHWCILNQLARP